MNNILTKVSEFHDAFGVKNGEIPNIPTGQICKLRYNLLQEENEEYIAACEKRDIVEMADALGDMLYILAGTMLVHGMQDKIEEVFEEIHKSNMSKLGPAGKPLYREDGKVLKGPNYFKPNITSIMIKK